MWFVPYLFVGLLMLLLFIKISPSDTVATIFFIKYYYFLLLVLEWLLFGGILFADSTYQRLLYKVHTSNTEMSF